MSVVWPWRSMLIWFAVGLPMSIVAPAWMAWIAASWTTVLTSRVRCDQCGAGWKGKRR